MKAITLWPEWAFAVCALFKRVENRGWAPPLKMIGQRFLIHAGAAIGGRPGNEAHDDRAMQLVCETAKLVGWHWQRRGPCHYLLEAAVPLRHPEFDVLVSPSVEFTRDLIPRGALVAEAILDRVSVPPPLAARERFEVRQSSYPWATLGAHHWHLRTVGLLRRPVPCKGAQRLWTVDDHLAREAARELCPTESIAEMRWKELTNGVL
jgi:hypothetical protein